jgi:signal transduction histidine kinase
MAGVPSGVLVAVVGVSFVGTGLVAWRSRPGNRVGALMVVVGLLWVMRWLPQPWRWPAMVGVFWPAVLAHLVMALPTGRLGALSARLVVGLCYLDAGYVAALVARGQEPAAATGGEPETWAIVLLGLAVLGLQVVRWWRSSASRRRSLRLVLGAAAVATTLFVVWRPLVAAGTRVPWLVVAVQVALAAIPVATLVGVLRRRIDRGRVADLVVRLNETPRPGGVRDALVAALHDTDLRIGYWVPEADRYVDTNGAPVPLPPAGDRAATRVDRAGDPVALLIHDAALLDNPALIEAACAAAALALENERLTAELRAQLRQLARSRSRILQAAEAERRRLERDLHDGVQQRLLSIPMALTLAESALSGAGDPGRAVPLIGEAKDTALAVLDELRALCQGIHPPVLTERGLRGAVQELTAVTSVPVRLALDLSRPLPAEVETTAYYVVAEALANIVKHAEAAGAGVTLDDRGGRLLVEVRDDGRGGAEAARGSGLRGLADRVEATGGTFEVTSLPSAGTAVRAVLPCG